MALSDAMNGQDLSLRALLSSGYSVEDIEKLLAVQGTTGLALPPPKGLVGPQNTGPAPAPAQTITPDPNRRQSGDKAPTDKPKSVDKDSKLIKKMTEEFLERYGSVGYGAAFDSPNVRLSEALSAEELQPKSVELPVAAERGFPPSDPKPPSGNILKRAAGGVAAGVGKAVSGIGTAMSELGNISPRTSNTMGRLAVALGGNQDPRVRSGLGQRLGQAGMASAQQKVMAMVTSGQQVSPGDLSVLTPQQLTQVAELQIKKQAEARQAKQSKSTINYQTKLGKQAEATANKLIKETGETPAGKVVQWYKEYNEEGKTGLYLETVEHNSETGEWDVKASAAVNDITDAETKASKKEPLYDSAEVRLTDEAIAEVFYPIAATISEGAFSNPLRSTSVTKGEIRGLIQSDPALKAAFNELSTLQYRLLAGGVPLAQVNDALRRHSQAILPDASDFKAYWKATKGKVTFQEWVGQVSAQQKAGK